jgi:hypothetical protein
VSQSESVAPIADRFRLSGDALASSVRDRGSDDGHYDKHNNPEEDPDEIAGTLCCGNGACVDLSNHYGI